jgi:lipopolysaccharide transport system permease protein
MFKKESIKRSIRQILAIVEKEIHLELRVKTHFAVRYISPLIQLFLTLFIFGLIFSIQENFKLGYWNEYNYILFLLLAYCIGSINSLISKFQSFFNGEKYWKTLSALMVAPVHRFTLLIGIIIFEFIMMSIPLFTFLIITYILYPISIFYVLLVSIIFFSIFLTFGSIGLVIGVFLISHEGYVPVSLLSIRIIFLFSCITYPIYVFPEIFHYFILINPFYYMFDLLRLTWYLGLDFNYAISYITPLHIIYTIALTIILLSSSLYLFERIYKKYGITGY